MLRLHKNKGKGMEKTMARVMERGAYVAFAVIAFCTCYKFATMVAPLKDGVSAVLATWVQAITPIALFWGGFVVISRQFRAGLETNKRKEDYLRHHDGSAVAAALLGELSSHGEALPIVKAHYQALLSMAEAGHLMKLTSLPAEQSLDPIFDAYVGKLGLLEHEIVTEVAFVYEHLRAFRFAVNVIASVPEMPAQRAAEMLRNIMQMLDRVEARGIPLLKKLKQRASEEANILMNEKYLRGLSD